MRNLVLTFILLSLISRAHADFKCAESFDDRAGFVKRARRGALAAFGYTPRPSLEIASRLRARWNALDDQFVISPATLAEWSRDFGLSPEDILVHLLPYAKLSARAPSSDYRVGVVGFTASGYALIGNNLEFPPRPHVQTVHAETFLLVLAYLRHLGPVRILASEDGKICGHCRQFMQETAQSDQMRIVVPGRRAVSMQTLLTNAFDPAELGASGLLLTPQDHALRVSSPDNLNDPLVTRAVREARRSYAPYSHRYAGVALGTRDGRVFGGPFIEIVNYNSSMDPAAAAMIDLVSHGVAYDQITEVVLAEQRSVNPDKDIVFADSSRALVRSRAPYANFRLVTVSP